MAIEVKLILEADGEQLECDACGNMIFAKGTAYILTAGELEEVIEVRCKGCFDNERHDAERFIVDN